MRSMAAETDPVLDMLASIALDQGAAPDEVFCGRRGPECWLEVGGNRFSASALLLEEGVWPAYIASAMAANANGLPMDTDLAAFAEAYDSFGQPSA